MPFAACVECGRHFAREVGEEWKVRCLRCWIARQRRREEPAHQAAPRPELSELREQLPRLIQLCHPDKHAGSRIATSTTQWLLDVRRRLN